MKKLIYSALLAGMTMSLAACSSEEPAVENRDGNVTFTIEVPAGMATRAYSDGLTATKLHYYVYDEDKASDNNIAALNGEADFSSLKTTVSLNLVTGKKYSIVFWADKPDNSVYTYSVADKTISVNYEGATAQDEDRDAFFAYEAFQVTGPISKTITLKRPFAQINVGTTDMAAAEAAGLTVAKTSMVVKGVYNKFDLSTGEVTGDPVDVTFAQAAIPGEGETFPYKKPESDTNTYTYLAMNYVLVNEKTTVDVTLSDDNANSSDMTFAAVPVQRNYRTNIFGALLTNPAVYNVVIDNIFLPEDSNIKIVTKSSELADALNKGGDIEIPAGATVNLEDILGTPDDTPAINVTKPTSLEVKGKLECGTGGQIQVKSHLSISGTGSIDTGIRGAFYVTTGGTLEAKDVTFNSPKAYRGGDVWNEGGGSMTFTNVTFNSNMATVYFQPAGEDDTLTMTGCVVNNTSKNSIVNPETNSRVWSYAIRVQGGKAVLKDLTVNAVQGAVAVGSGAVCDIMSGTYTVNDSEPGKGDGFYCVYVAREGVANVYDGKFASVRISVFNGNEDVPGDKFGFVNLYGGKYSSMGKNQSGEVFTLPEGYEYAPLTDEDPYKWEVVKSNS